VSVDLIIEAVEVGLIKVIGVGRGEIVSLIIVPKTTSASNTGISQRHELVRLALPL
jgi:hypothetical protein